MVKIIFMNFLRKSIENFSREKYIFDQKNRK